MNRRNFLRGCLAVTALAILPVPELHAYPVLYGDGVHDDTEAVQAIMDLKPFVVEGRLLEGYENCVLRNANLNISKSISVNNHNTLIENCKIKYTGPQDSYCFDIYGGKCIIAKNILNLEEGGGGIRINGSTSDCAIISNMIIGATHSDFAALSFNSYGPNETNYLIK